jgi:hypothetical protein
MKERHGTVTFRKDLFRPPRLRTGAGEERERHATCSRVSLERSLMMKT